MPARSLVIGLDGADLDLIRDLGEARLPTLFSLMKRGAFARLESVQPPATLPNWTTFLTGVDPAVHGVFDFTLREGYSVRFTGGTIREAPTLFSRLDALGLRTACVGFPATWPPEELEHGVFVSGWDAPVAFEADRSFVWPPSLYDAIRERFGTPRFDDVDEFDADAPGWVDALPASLEARIGRKKELARWLLEVDDWDVFAFYFGESDTASHYLWSLHDEGSPRRPEEVTDGEGLARVYQAIDAALAELLEAAGGEEVELTLLSDHGFGGSSDKVLYLNRALREAGLLVEHRSELRSKLVARVKEMALTLLPPKLREQIFRFGGSLLPSWLESRARFGRIDMSLTSAFSDELNYFPAVHLNVKGREPRGVVERSDIPRVTREVETALLSLRDPWTGAPVVSRVYRREELFEGPFLERAPDLLLELNLDEGYSYNLMPSASAPSGVGLFRRLSSQELLGRKGRSLPGSHRSHGLMVLAGRRVHAVGEVDAHIADVSATLLARMDLAVPAEFRGRVLYEAIDDEAADDLRDLPEVTVPTSRERGDEARVEARLRALGYID